MNPKKVLSAGLTILMFAACQQSAEPYLELETDLLTFEPEGGASTVIVSSNVYYRVNNDCTDDSGEHHWAKITSSDVNGEQTMLHFDVEKNTGLSERVGTVRFIGDNVTPLKLTLKQKGFVPSGIEPEAAELENTGGSATFKVFGNRSWTAKCSDADVLISPASGFGETMVTVTVPANRELTARTIVVNVEMEGIESKYPFTLIQKAFVARGIDPSTAELESSAVSSTFKVYGDCNWTAKCSDADVFISPASGFGETMVTVTVPENGELSVRTITVEVEFEGDEQVYAYIITHKAYSGVLADWNLNALKSVADETFKDASAQTVFPGTNGRYLNADTGSGKIEYYAAERTGYMEPYSCTRGVGGNGDPLISYPIPEDYWLITVNKRIPAGTNLHYYFVTKPGTAVSSYWMIEYNSGDGWKPTIPVSTKSESSEKGIKNAVEYSADIEYNFAGTVLASDKSGAYMAVEGIFAVDSDVEPLLIRFRQAGHLGLDGGKFSGMYIDQPQSGWQSRISAQRPSLEDGTAVKTYDQHITIETTE